MGFRLVALALHHGHGRVSDRALLTLVAMANTARDSPGTKTIPPGIYFGGASYLWLCLGYPPDDPTHAGERAVTRMWAELEAAGLIKRAGKRHKHTRWELTHKD